MTRKILIALFGIGLMLSFPAQAGHSNKHGHGYNHDHHKKHHGHHHNYPGHHPKKYKHRHRERYGNHVQHYVRPRVEMGAHFVYLTNGGVVVYQPYLYAHLGY